MGNCLVTKLKGTVDNDMLSDFGFQVIKYNYNGDINLSLWLPKSRSNKSIKMKGDGYFVDNNGNNVGKIINRTVTPNIAGISKIHANGDVLLELENGIYEDDVRDIKINNTTAALPVFDSSVLPLIYNGVKRPASNNIYYCQKIKGKLSDIITGVQFGNIGIEPSSLSPEFVGNIADVDFGSNSIWPYNIIIKNCPNVYGNLNTFLDNLAVAVARYLPYEQQTTKSVLVELINTGILYNGSLVGDTFSKKFIINQDGSWKEHTT